MIDYSKIKNQNSTFLVIFFNFINQQNFKNKTRILKEKILKKSQLSQVVAIEIKRDNSKHYKDKGMKISKSFQLDKYGVRFYLVKNS